MLEQQSMTSPPASLRKKSTIFHKYEEMFSSIKVNSYSANCKTNKAHFKFQRRLERALLIASLIFIVKIVSLDAWLPPWRNGLAHWTSSSKVVGSSPTGGAFSISFFHLEILKNYMSTPCKVKLDFNFAFFGKILSKIQIKLCT